MNTVFTIQKFKNTMWKCTGISSFVQKCVLYALYYILHQVHSYHKIVKHISCCIPLTHLITFSHSLPDGSWWVFSENAFLQLSHYASRNQMSERRIGILFPEK